LIALIGTLVLQWLYPQDWAGHGNRNFVTEAVLLLMALSGESTRLKLPWVLIVCIAAVFLWINPSKIEYVVILFLMVVYGAKLYRLRSRKA
jgi:hypothetical protein